VNVAGEFGRVHGVEVVKDWAKVYARIKAADDVRAIDMASPPKHFSSDADIVVEEEIAAKPGIDSTRQRDRIVIAVRAACTGSFGRADAESNVDFLSLGEIRKGGQGGAGKRQEYDHSNCAFHSKPPRDF
jgi:hypothetical protein